MKFCEVQLTSLVAWQQTICRWCWRYYDNYSEHRHMNTTLGLPRHSPQLCFWWMIDRSLWRILILTRTGDYKPLPLRTKSLLTPLPDLFHFLSQLVPILCRAGGGATHWGEVVIICMDWFMVTHFSDCESYNELLLFREESKIFLPIKQRRYMATRIAAPPSHCSSH